MLTYLRRGRLILTAGYICFLPKVKSFLNKNKERDWVVRLADVRGVKVESSIQGFGPGIRVQVGNDSFLFVLLGTDARDVSDRLTKACQALKEL